MDKKYELTNETREWDGVILHRIKALRDFGDVKAKQYGGWIEKEENLSHEGNCWVADNAMVCGNAKVHGDAWVGDRAWVYGDAKVCGDAWVHGDAWVYGDANVYGDAEVGGCAWVSGYTLVCDSMKLRDGLITSNKDLVYLRNFWSSGRDVTYNFTSDTWITGCFRGTTYELLIKAYEDNETKGKYFEALVEFIKKAKYIKQGD